MIPRPFLDGLAATRTLDRTSAVLIAVICRLYGDQENSGSETPSTSVPLSSLVKLTGRDIRSVQKATTILYRAGVLFDVDVQPGRAKVLGLKPGPKEPTPTTGHGRQNGQGYGAKTGRGTVPKRAGVPTPDSAHTHKRSLKNLLEETSSERTLAAGDVEVARSSNGHGPAVQTVALHDLDRHDRVHKALVYQVDDCRYFKGQARQRWLAVVGQLAIDATAREDLSESTIGRRARDFFVNEHWVNLGNDKQVRYFRQVMLKAIQKRRSVAQ